jgi:IclR family KDG regulon transcriptional repressor
MAAGEGEQNSGSNLSTVSTAVSIVEYIGARGAVQPVDIARDLELARANVHRHLITLESIGYVEKDKRGMYTLTFKLFELGNTVPYHRGLIDTARPSMLRLAQLTGETVNNAVLFDDEVLYIDKVEAVTHLKLDRSIGSSDPLHCTSLGKVLLAFQPVDRREKMLERLDLNAYTPNTITDLQQLRETLDQVRRNGCAYDLQELSRDLNCVAAPVFDPNDSIVAAVSISGPADRFTFEKLQRYLPELQATAREITREQSTENGH